MTAINVQGQTMVCLAHTAAMVCHASALDLIKATGDLAADVAALAAIHPGLAGLTDTASNPAATVLSDPAVTDALTRHDVTDPPYRADGYPLGELYQQLSVEARKGRALCQTPRFVSELLLEVSFDHAYREHGPHLRMIDPSCGTGHILVETLIHTSILHSYGFGRDRAGALPAGMTPLERVTAALDVVHGVDLDPYAVLVTRYRLLALAVTMLRSRRNEPTQAEVAGLPLHVAAADSLLAADEPLLARGTYHVVVANPPYITVKDAKINAAIRARYPQVCNGQYSLALPFHALMTELLTPGGWCAQLTANSFMKREFGKKYVEQYLATLDLRWVIDTSGAYIPGHGTPTVILVNRNRPPAGATVPTVMGIRGEPKRPEDPAHALVWTAIADAVRKRESLDRFTETFAPKEEQPRPELSPVVPLAFDQPSLFELVGAA